MDDEDDWNPSKAAGVCMMLLSTLCEDDVLEYVSFIACLPKFQLYYMLINLLTYNFFVFFSS